MKRAVSMLLVLMMIMGAFSATMAVSAATKITSVYILDITDPVAGTVPDYKATTGNSTYEIDYVIWYDLTDKKFLEEGDGRKFTLGHDYKVDVYIDSANGYEFATKSNGGYDLKSAMINGKSAVIGRDETTAAFARVCLSYTFTNVSYRIVTNVSVYNIDEPVAGQIPDYKGDVGASYYEIDYIDWYDETAKRFLSEGSGRKFEEGHTYSLYVFVDVTSGNEFDVTNNKYNLTATLNGRAITPTKDDTTSAWARLYLKRQYTITKKVTSVSVSDINAPRIGTVPDYTGTVGDSSYEIDYIIWYDETDKTFLEQGDGKTFKAGHKYKLYVYVDVASGFGFDATNTAYNVTAKLNGKSVTPKKDDTTAAWARLFLVYDYTLPPYITDVSISNIDDPAVGKTPDYTGTVGANTYSIDYIIWYDETAKKFLESGDGKKFELGHKYTLYVYVDADAQNNHEFSTTSGSYNFTAKLNGNSIKPTKDDGTQAWARLFLKKTYDTLTATVKEVEISGIDAPTMGKLPDFTAVTGASSYEIDYVIWYDETDKKFLEQGDGKSFKEGHVYTLYVYVDAARGYEFAVDASSRVHDVKGFLNGKSITPSKDDTTAAFARLYFKYTYPAVIDTTNYIKDVTISGINAPAVGATPDFSGKTGASSYEIDYVIWYDLTDEKFLEEGDGRKFEVGHKYRLYVYVDADLSGGCEFAVTDNKYNVTAKLNGETVKAIKDDTTAIWARAYLMYDYPELTEADVPTDDPDDQPTDNPATDPDDQPTDDPATDPDDQPTDDPAIGTEENPADTSDASSADTAAPSDTNEGDGAETKDSGKSDKDKDNDDKNDENDGGIGIGVIIAIAAGVVAVAAVVVVLVLKKKKK